MSKENFHVDAIAIANSILAGLVAITAGSDVIRPDLSLIIGVGGTIAYHGGSQFLDYFKLDDVRVLLPDTARHIALPALRCKPHYRP